MNAIILLHTIWLNIITSSLRRNLLWIGVLYLLIGWIISNHNIQQEMSLSNLILIFFAGPSNWDYSFIDFLTWFIPPLICFYILGIDAKKNLVTRGYIILPKIGSRIGWLLGEAASILLLVFCFVMWIIIFLVIGAVIAHPAIDMNLANQISITNASVNLLPITGIQILLISILLLSLTLSALTITQMVLSLILKQPIYSLLIMSSISMLSWLISINRPWLTKWLPGAQSMLIRHTFIDVYTPGLTLQWSLIYDSVMIFGSVIIGLIWIKELDIFGYSEDI